MAVTEDLKTIASIAAEAVTRGLKISPPTTDHRIYAAFNKLAEAKRILSENDQSRFDTAFAAKLKKVSPDWHFFDSTTPDSDDLDFNFAVYSSLRIAGGKLLAEYEFRDNMKDLGAKTSGGYAEAIDVFRERVADLELVAGQMSEADALELETQPEHRIVTGDEMAAITHENRINKSTVVQRAIKVGRALTFKK